MQCGAVRCSAVFPRLLRRPGEIRGNIVPEDSIITRYKAEGTAGSGLLSSNQAAVVLPAGSGGVDPAVGLIFDSGTSNFAFGLRWGSGNGFTDLSGAVTVAHIHGPTASVSPLSFSENAGIGTDANGALFNIHQLAGFSSSATDGSVKGQFKFTATTAGQLQTGQLYLNVHTAQNG